MTDRTTNGMILDVATTMMALTMKEVLSQPGAAERWMDPIKSQQMIGRALQIATSALTVATVQLIENSKAEESRIAPENLQKMMADMSALMFSSVTGLVAQFKLFAGEMPGDVAKYLRDIGAKVIDGTASQLEEKQNAAESQAAEALKAFGVTLNPGNKTTMH